MIHMVMLLRVLAILGLLIQPLAVAVGLEAAACDQRDVVAAASSQMPACGCCEMATSCSPDDSPMVCGCMESNEPVAPTPAAPRNENSRSLAVPVLLTSALTVDLPDASHPALTARTFLFYRSHTHKQATLCVWRT